MHWCKTLVTIQGSGTWYVLYRSSVVVHKISPHKFVVCFLSGVIVPPRLHSVASNAGYALPPPPADRYLRPGPFLYPIILGGHSTTCNGEHQKPFEENLQHLIRFRIGSGEWVINHSEDAWFRKHNTNRVEVIEPQAMPCLQKLTEDPCR